MKGLRTQEGKKFKLFFEKVQIESAKKNGVFFLDCGDGKLFEDANIECESLFGWLIPLNKVYEFEPIFNNHSEKVHDFDDYYVYVDYKANDDQSITIIIDDSPNDLIIDDFTSWMKDVEVKAN